MEDPDDRIDLFCLLGMTPQVVTEALAALARQGRRPGCLTLYTTKGVRGLEQIALERAPDRWSPGPRLEDLHAYLPATRPSDGMRVETYSGNDPRDDDGLRTLGRHLDACIRDAIERAEQRPLVVCISGGRKTMSAWATLSLSLRARAGDRLVHVLVPASLESPELWPPRRGTNDLDEIALGDLPVPRIGALLSARDRTGQIDELIARATERAGEQAPLRVIHEAGLHVERGGRRLGLPPQAVAMLAFYVESRGEVAWKDLTRAQRDRLGDLYRMAGKRGARTSLQLATDASLSTKEITNAHTKLRRALREHAPGLDLEFEPDNIKDRGLFRVRGAGLDLAPLPAGARGAPGMRPRAG